MDSSEEDTEYCDNCKRDIPAVNFVMHQTHCVRNIVLCKKCQEPVPRSELDAHEEEYHVLEVCDCGKSFEKESMEDHKTNGCRLRKVKCEYCELELNFEKMSEHKDFCGSRTEKCEKCKAFVKLRDQSAHELNGCRQSTLTQFEKYPHLPGFFYPGRLEHASGWPENNRAGEFNEGVHVSPEPYVRQTVMEELDSNAMIGQRRSLKNETTQRHNKKNERAIQNAQMYNDVTDGSNLLKQQQEEEDYLLAFQLANIEADSAMVRQTQRGSNVSPTNMSPVFQDPYRSSPPDVFNFSPSTSGISHSPQPDPINSNPFFRGSYRSSATNPITSVQSVPDAGFETDFTLDRHNPPSDVEIPCEFCRQLFLSSELFMHQEECQYGRNRTDDALNSNGAVEFDRVPRLTSRDYSAEDVGDFFMPPRTNPLPSSLGVRYPPTTLTTPDSQSEVSDRMAPAIRKDSYRDKDYSSEEDETVMVPCEFCEELFPFDAVTFHQIHCAPENRYAQDDMRNYGFESPGVTDVAQPHVVQARHPVNRSVVEEFPEPPRRARKHQPDPIFDSFIPPKFETKVGVVSKEKTVNMLQRTHEEKLVNKGTAERMTSQPQKKVNALFQQSKYSAFDRPERAVAVVSVEKTQKMQRELRQGNIPNRTGHLTNFSSGLSQFSGLQTSAGTKDRTDYGVGSSSGRRQVNREQACDVLNDRTENVTSSPTDLSQIDWQQMPEVMNGRKAKREDFELSSNVIRNTRGKPPSSSSSSNRNRDSNLRIRMAFEDDDLIQDSTMNQNDSSFTKSRSTSESSAPQGKREKTWEDMLEEMNKSPSTKLNPTSSPEARSRNLTEKNNMVTSLNRSSQKKDNQGKRGRTAQRNCERKLSSSSLSSRVTLPQSATVQKSLVVQGSSPSNLRKKENGERRGDTKLRDAQRTARPSDFEMDFDTDYVKQTITGVSQFMASNKSKGGAASKSNNSRKGQLTEDRGQWEREQRGRRNRSPRIVANFTEGDRESIRNNREARNRRRNSNCRSTNQYE